MADLLAAYYRGLPAAARSGALIQPFEPEEHESLLGKVLSQSMSLVEGLGNIVDTPASIGRDILAGQNPVDQLLRPWAGDNRIWGRELARQYNLAGPQDTWLNFLGGLGLEIGLDPLTYMTFGGSALTKTGQMLSKAGLLNKNMLPKIIREGERLGKFAGGTVLERALDAAKYRKPRPSTLGPRTSRLFGTAAHTLADPITGELSPLSLRALYEAGGGSLDDLLQNLGPQAQRRFREAAADPNLVSPLALPKGGTLQKALGSQLGDEKQVSALLKALEGERIGGSIGFGLPFMPAAFTLTPGKWGARWAQRTDRIGEWYRKTAVGRHLRAWLNPAIRPDVAKHFDAQEAALTAFWRKSRIEMTTRTTFARMARKVSKAGDELVKSRQGTPLEAHEMVKIIDGADKGRIAQIEEITGDTATIRVRGSVAADTDKPLNQLQRAGGRDAFPEDDLRGALEGVLIHGDKLPRQLRTELKDQVNELNYLAQLRSRELGIPAHDVDDRYAEYVARTTPWSAPEKEGWQIERKGETPLTTRDPYQLARIRPFRNWVGGTAEINELYRDPAFIRLIDQLKESRAGNHWSSSSDMTDFLDFLKNNPTLKNVKGDADAIESWKDATKARLTVREFIKEWGEERRISFLKKARDDLKIARKGRRSTEALEAKRAIQRLMPYGGYFGTLDESPVFDVRPAAGGRVVYTPTGRRAVPNETQILNGIIGVAEGMDPAQMARGVFPHDPLHDSMVRAMVQQEVNNNHETILHTLAHAIGPLAGQETSARLRTKLQGRVRSALGLGRDLTIEEGRAIAKEATKETYTLRQALNKLELPMHGGDEVSGPLKFMWEYRNTDRAATLPQKYVRDAQGRITNQITDRWRNELHSLLDLKVDKNLVNDLIRTVDTLKDSTALDGFQRWIVDSYTNLFKAWQTSPFPGFHVRNFYGGQFANWVRGHFSPRSVSLAHRVMSGEVVPELVQAPAVKLELARRNITDLKSPEAAKEATDIVKDWLYGGDLYGAGAGTARSHGAVGDVVGQDVTDILEEDVVPDPLGVRPPVGEKIRRIHLPATTPYRWGHIAQTATGIGEEARLPGQSFWEAWRNPLAARGVAWGAPGPRRVTEFPLLRAGEMAGEYTEGLNRVSPFIKQLLDGANPQEAIRQVYLNQVNYAPSSYNKFELDYLTRIFPFYKWVSRMMPWTVRELIERPGGRLAQTIRTQAALRGDPEDSYMPDRVRRGMAIRLGETAPGMERFLSQIDLVHEGALQPFTLGMSTGDTLMKTLQGIGGSMNPLLRMPIELATETQLYSGRDLPSLKGGVGTIVSNIEKQLGRDVQPREDLLPTRLEHALYGFVGRPLHAARQITGIGTRTGKVGQEAFDASVNLLTGARISLMDMERERAFEAKRRLEELIRYNPLIKNFSDVYVPRENFPFISEQDLIYLRLLEGLERERREKAKAAAP